MSDNIKRELEEARNAIISLAPQQFHGLLHGNDTPIQTDRDLERWKDAAIDKVIASIEQPASQEEVTCPLCGSDGYGLSLGLASHLDGHRDVYRVDDCVVFKAARQLMHDRTQAKRVAAAQAEDEARALRRKTEPVLRIDPDPAVEPQLMVGEKYWTRPRPTDQFPAVDEGLRELGFEIEHENNVFTYKYKPGNNWMVLADPREHRTIKFCLFRRSGDGPWNLHRTWSIHDAWGDWPDQFRTRLKLALQPDQPIRRRDTYERMTPMQRICHMFYHAHSDDRKVPAAILLYNEGWLSRLVVDWFSGHRQMTAGHHLHFAPGADWFSEARLHSQFLERRRRDNLAEGATCADAIVGHYKIGKETKARVELAEDASQLALLEVKLASPLSTWVSNDWTHGTNNRKEGFDQAARSVACMAHMLFKARRKPTEVSQLKFILLAPEKQIGRKVFSSLLEKGSIKDKVRKRVAQYADSPDAQAKEQWFQDWFIPTLELIEVKELAWEETIEWIQLKDPVFGAELLAFYKKCLQFNPPRQQEG